MWPSVCCGSTLHTLHRELPWKRPDLGTKEIKHPSLELEARGQFDTASSEIPRITRETAGRKQSDDGRKSRRGRQAAAFRRTAVLSEQRGFVSGDRRPRRGKTRGGRPAG